MKKLSRLRVQAGKQCLHQRELGFSNLFVIVYDVTPTVVTQIVALYCISALC